VRYLEATLRLVLLSFFLITLTVNASELRSGSSVPGEWLLKRKPGTSLKQLKSELAGKVKWLGTLGPNRQYVRVREFDRGTFSPRKLRLSSVSETQPNFVYRASDADPDFDKSWGLKNTGQPVGDAEAGTAGADTAAWEAWAIHPNASDRVVAILDTGIDYNHEDLKANVWRNAKEIPGNGKDDDKNGYVDDVRGWNFVLGTADNTDDNDHGSICAGIIGAESNNGKGTRGIAGNVKLMALKSLDKAGLGTTASAIEAIRYAVDNGANVINASWGGGAFDPALYDVVKWAGERGVLFVAAAGNDAKDNDQDPNPTYPASFRLPTVISVAAYDNRDGLANFSNIGRTSVHLGAPGVKIFSTARLGTYRFGEGTSFAAPYVSGAAALVSSFVPTLDASALRDRILATTEVINYYQKELIATAGRLNVRNALKDVRPPRPAAPNDWRRIYLEKSSPHPYTNNFSMTLKFQQPGATHIRVHFSKFDTEACCDQVILRDRENKIVRIYRGELGEFFSADALGDTLHLEFIADYSMTRYGFDIDAVEFSYREDRERGLFLNGAFRPEEATPFLLRKAGFLGRLLQNSEPVPILN